MRINSVVMETKGGFGRTVSSIAFERKLEENEKPDYSQTVDSAMDYLGITNRSLIIHGPSFPANPKNGYEQEIGSPYGNQDFIDFIKLHGFNSVQLGPMGKLNRGDNSPYTSSVLAKNPLFIDLAKLKDKEYASILSDEELSAGLNTPEATSDNYTRTDFDKARQISEKYLTKAYDNFITKLVSYDPDALALNAQLSEFLEKNDFWINDYAVLDVIANWYGTDDYTRWDEPELRSLLTDIKKGSPEAKERYKNIQEENQKSIEVYKFSQFLIDKQSRESNNGITLIGDLLVGASSFDELANEDVFLKGYKVGASGGGLFNSPQLWGISLLDPNKLFNEDGSLGPSGIFLKQKLKRALDDTKSIRIDHVMGLVNPYIYNPDSIVYDEKQDPLGNMVKYPLKEHLEADYLSNTGLDENHNFEKILERIVIPTLLEAGVDPKSVVWENLGHDPTGVFQRVYYDKLKLNGISGMLWTKGKDVPKENWSYIGCHDNMPVKQIIEDRNGMALKWEKGWNRAWDTNYLAQYTRPQANTGNYAEKLNQDNKSLIKAKWVDLLRSGRNIQISFMDFFGINHSYNTPGSTKDTNWTLRVNSNYEDTYHKSLEQDSYALNMPELLADAVEAKAYDEHKTKEVSSLVHKLRHYENVLKEAE